MADVDHQTIRSIAISKGAPSGRVDPSVDYCGACGAPSGMCSCVSEPQKAPPSQRGSIAKPSSFKLKGA